MIRRVKKLEMMKIVFINHLSTLDSKVFLTLKIMDFENVALTKSCSYICDKGLECIMYMI
jgi:hypothetical protein